MTKRLIGLLLLLLTALTVYAQITVQDSLKWLLNGSDELKLNPEAVKIIDFGGLVGTPMVTNEKTWILLDETLPSILNNMPLKKDAVLTLYPYNANTRFDWDPIYKKKIKVGPNTWRGDSYSHRFKTTYKSNWVEKLTNGRARSSTPTPGMLGLSVAIDVMAPLTKEFWDFKGRKRRARALEVMQTYGDSTTASFPYPLPKKVAFR